MKIDVLIALIVCIGAAILICILFLGILLQQRRQVRRERNRHKRNTNDQKTNNKSSSPNHDEFYQDGDNDTADAEVAPPPPIRMVVVTTSTSSSSFPSGKHDMTSSIKNQTRPGLEKSISERSGVDVWQLRQDDRKEYILEHILYKKVTHSLLFGTLQLPHLDDLSLRGRERGRSSVIVVSNNGEGASNRNEAHDETSSFSRQAHKDDKKNNEHYNKVRYNTTDMTSSIGGGTVMTPISMTSEESHPVSSSLQQQQPQQEHQHQYSHWTCPICMEPYESGDMICWSRNENCPHAFHLECKVGYLLNTDECILCRNNFLNHPHQEEQGLVVVEEEKEKNVMGMGQV